MYTPNTKITINRKNEKIVFRNPYLTVQWYLIDESLFSIEDVGAMTAGVKGDGNLDSFDSIFLFGVLYMSNFY
jgi:hypothetical protein